MSGEYSRDGAIGDAAPRISLTGDESNLENVSPVAIEAPKLDEEAPPPPPSGPPRAVEQVLSSEIGITTLLNRLKQSIASARDFATFLKKRSTLEEEQATGLKRLAKTQLENVRKIEHRGEGFAVQLADVFRVHERMGDNGMQFALSLHQMHEDLQELTNNMERGRKQWKHDGLDAEKRASDAEAAMQKAKTKYDNLAEDYDRARTGDTKGSRRIGLKGPKSAEQYEQDLLRKTQAADADYEEKVRQAKAQREHLINKGRPEAVRALQDLIRECDSALTLQLQKFATFNEKLLLGNGLAVSPLNDSEAPGAQRSLRDIIVSIDNENDFHTYVSSALNRVPPRPSEIQYEKHPTMMPKTQKPSQPATSNFAVATNNQPPLAVNTTASQPSSMASRYNNNTAQATVTNDRPYQQSPTAYQQSPQAAAQSQPPPVYSQQAPYNHNTTPNREAYNGAPPYPTYASERTTAPPPSGPPAHTSNFVSNASPSGPPRQMIHHTRPVFGVSLDELFHRDQSAVPMVVFQCMQAVDMFGLEMEGIYRMNGSSSSVNALRNAFDTLPPTAPQLDFRNPANFYQDVNVVTTLLKMFFRDLPDPLFTNAGYATFINAARIEAADARRDAMHQAINDLPDPNYATLRALVLHLHRVMQREDRTRMGSSNLAVCVAPSLMGTSHPGAVADAALQARVIDTILINATAIFDDD